MAETLPELYVRIATATPERLRSIRSTVPEELDAVVQQCLEKQPENRFQNVAALAVALGSFASDEGRRSVAKVARILGLDLPAVGSARVTTRAGAPAPPPEPPAEPTREPAPAPVLEPVAAAPPARADESAPGAPIVAVDVPMAPEAEIAPTEKITPEDLARTTGLPSIDEGAAEDAERASWQPPPSDVVRQTSAAWGATQSDTRRGGAMIALVAVGIVGLAGVAVAIALARGDDQPPSEPAAAPVGVEMAAPESTAAGTPVSVAAEPPPSGAPAPDGAVVGSGAPNVGSATPAANAVGTGSVRSASEASPKVTAAKSASPRASAPKGTAQSSGAATVPDYGGRR
jgi:serine/threonine-protein kinase